MHVRLIAIGERQPAWVDEAFDDYVRRLPRQWRFRLDTVALGRRGKKTGAKGAVESEGRRVLEKLTADERLVLLDERGTEVSSLELAAKLKNWLTAGIDLCFVIGGPDGVSKACQTRADFRWSLSKLTLPHGLARVLFAEQLYRAWAVSSHHPYHRG